VALAIERALWGRREHRGLVRLPLSALTFLIVTAGWAFFRAKTFGAAVFVLGQMFSRAAGDSMLNAWQWRLALVALLLALGEEYGQVLTRLDRSPAWARTTASVMALLAIEIFTASDQSIPFVYFQF
jgi:alginate O-acetyltransferase complex protein AlgI